MNVHVPEKKEILDQLYIFPLIKRNEEQKVSPEVKKEDIEKLAFHYVKQLIHQIHNHGFTMDSSFFRDIELVHESLQSSLLRSVGMYHELQEYVDELRESDVPETFLDEEIELAPAEELETPV